MTDLKQTGVDEKLGNAEALPGTTLPLAGGIGRDNNFNFLRLMLAALVLLSHSPELIDGNRSREILSRIFHKISFGELAVDGFFLVSGFLIVQSWQRQPRFLSFLGKRVLRIYPAFVVASLVSGLIVGPLAANASAYFAGFKPWAFLDGMVELKGPYVPPTFTQLHFPVVNGALWTISQEFRCYLIVPLLSLLGVLKDRRRWLLFTVAILLCALFAPDLPYRFMHGPLWDVILPEGPWDSYRLLSFFCAGGCFFLFRHEIRYNAKWVPVAAIFTAFCLFHGRSAQLGLMTTGAYVLFWLAFARLPAGDFFRTHTDVSYGLYLYGWPTQSLIILYFPHISPWVLFPLSLAICVGLGFVSWHLVELPFLRLKPRRGPREGSTDPRV